MPSEDVRRLARWRKLRGLSQLQLADRMDIAYQSVNSFEHTENPSLETFKKYADALGLEVHIELRIIRERFTDEDFKMLYRNASKYPANECPVDIESG